MDIYRLVDYDEWASTELLKAVVLLSPEQFVREFSGPHSSVRQQFFHLLSVIDRYRARLAHDVVPDVLPESIATPQDLVVYERQVRGRLHDFVAGLAESDLSQVQEHMTRMGPFRASVLETLQHMVNHATYHRGQVACLLKLHGIDFADTDIILWLNR